MNKASHMVLDGTRAYWLKGDALHWEVCTPASTFDVWQFAYERFATHVWMLEPALELPPASGEWSVKEYQRHGRLATISIIRRGKGQVNIIFPYASSWEAVTPPDVPGSLLLGAISYLQEALGVTITGSAGGVGWELVKQLHPEWIEAVQGDWADMHFTAKAGPDLIWQHETLRRGEGLPQPARYIHKFDRRGAYPYTATQTEYGAGQPVHLEGEAAELASQHIKGHSQDVGVWRVTITYDGTRFNPDMPPIWKEDKGTFEATEGWLAGPIIRLLRAFGHNVTVHEGWVFPEKHDLLTKWANLLIDARDSFSSATLWKSRAAAALAAKWAKQCANSTIGFTAFKGFEDEDERRRPDIRLQTVARQREILRHNIEKVYKLTGKYPVMVYMDAVYYLSDYPTLVFSSFKDREDKPGGMKYEGSIEIDSEIAAMFKKRMATNRRLEALGKKGWVK